MDSAQTSEGCVTALLMARRELGAAIYDIIKSVTWRTDKWDAIDGRKINFRPSKFSRGDRVSSN